MNNRSSNEDIFDRIIKSEKKRRIKMFVSLFIATFLALILLYYFINVRNRQIHIEAFETEIKSEQSIRDTVINAYNHFIKMKENFDSIQLSNLFADTLDRYYLMENVSKEKIIKEDKRYMNRFPNMKYYVDTSTYLVKTDSLFNNILTVKGKFCRVPSQCSDILEEVHFNSNFKIKYVRALLLTNYENQ